MRQELDIDYDSEIGAYFGTSRPMSQAELKRQLFRFDRLPSSDRAFIDAALPGHERILLGALGGGTAEENLDSQVANAENYHIDFIRAEPGNGAALHSHDSEETFICLTGRWKVAFGDHGEETIELNYLDGIVCPSGVMRSFENIADHEALLLSILGSKSPGYVVWAQALRPNLLDISRNPDQDRQV